jgi:hypothetical protein
MIINYALQQSRTARKIDFQQSYVDATHPVAAGVAGTLGSADFVF